jgi:hypothetical protein
MLKIFEDIFNMFDLLEYKFHFKIVIYYISIIFLAHHTAEALPMNSSKNEIFSIILFLVFYILNSMYIKYEDSK